MALWVLAQLQEAAKATSPITDFVVGKLSSSNRQELYVFIQSLIMNGLFDSYTFNVPLHD